ncbi:MAG: carbohydrate ABC transporter permease, partial [Nitrospinota bacterium]
MSDRKFGTMLLVPAAVFILGLAVIPVLQSFWLSFHRILLTLPALGEPFVGLENYRRLAADPEAQETLGFTFLFVFGTTLCEMALGLVMALTLNRSFKGRGWVRAAVLIPWAVPTVVASQMWRFIFNDQFGLANLLIFAQGAESYRAWLAEPWSARAAIMAADVWKTSSFTALLILAGLQTIPDELYEAARIDGARPWT